MTNPPGNWLLERCRAALTVFSFLGCCICLHTQQYLGLPLLWYDKELFYSWQASIKESTALLLLGLNQWRVPSIVDISCDSSVEAHIRRSSTGNVVFDAPDRAVLIANHQLYTDWIYIWWSAYTAGHHGHIVIMLKDALRKIPILGRGMTFFSFIFMSRKWETDEAELRSSMGQLSDERLPMWLLMFPEGTNLSARSRGLSKKWAEKMDIADFELSLIPRTRGLQLCLSGLGESVEWLYDCTIAYDGIPPNIDGQDIYNLKSMYVEGRGSPKAHMHWRRFPMSTVPFREPEAFDRWLYDRWAEKDEVLKHHQKHGSFPSSGHQIRAEVKLGNVLEVLKIAVSFVAALVAWGLVKLSLRALSVLWSLV